MMALILTNMGAKELINWGELSRLLSGSRMNIRKNRIPQKYEPEVSRLFEQIENWKSNLKKNSPE